MNEEAGKLTGDRSRELGGKAQQLKGKAEEKIGTLKRGAREDAMQEEMRSKVDQAFGKVNEEAGKLTGDRSTELGGKAQQLKGKAEERSARSSAARSRAELTIRVLAALAIVLASCSSSIGPRTTDHFSTTVAVESAAPASCSDREVRQVLTDFIGAFNRGDDPARFFAPLLGGYSTGFQWYSASGRGLASVRIYERKDLAAYFAWRQSVGERWSELNLLHVAEGQSYPRADFGFLITRSAPDLALLEPIEGTLGQTQGKGALNCKDRGILVFTM